MMNNMIEEVNERLKEILSQYRPGLVKEAMNYTRTGNLLERYNELFCDGWR